MGSGAVAALVGKAGARVVRTVEHLSAFPRLVPVALTRVLAEDVTAAFVGVRPANVAAGRGGPFAAAE